MRRQKELLFFQRQSRGRAVSHSLLLQKEEDRFVMTMLMITISSLVSATKEEEEEVGSSFSFENQEGGCFLLSAAVAALQ